MAEEPDAPARSSVMRRLAAIAVLLCALITGTAGAAPTEPLGHSGRWITDAQGRVVILHGFNTVPWDEQTLPRDFGMGADNARWLAENGFNTIRLGIYYARIEPQPGHFDPSYLDDFPSSTARSRSSGRCSEAA